MTEENRDEAKLRLGGMALRNGLLVHGPTHWAAAVRREDGTIAVGSGRKPRLRVADGVAGVRGLLRLAEAVVVLPLVKKGLPEARLPASTIVRDATLEIRSSIIFGAAAQRSDRSPANSAALMLFIRSRIVPGRPAFSPAFPCSTHAGPLAPSPATR